MCGVKAHGAGTEATDDRGWCPMMFAAQQGPCQAV